MIVIELEYKDHMLKVHDTIECGCSVYFVDDKDHLSLLLCPDHRKEMSVAIKQSIISKSKQ